MRLNTLDFETLSKTHFPPLFKWLNTPHVIEHWAGFQSIEEVAVKYGRKLDSPDGEAMLIEKVKFFRFASIRHQFSLK